MATGVGIQIDFSTNAKEVQRQINELGRSVASVEATTDRLRSALDKNKASSRALTGDIQAQRTFKKLNEEINHLAQERTRILTRGYNFGKQDDQIKGIIQQNEKLRIQHKILSDNATAMVNLGKNTQWAGRQLVVGFTVPLAIAAKAATKAFTEMETSVIKFRRVYGDAFTSTAEIDNMTKAVKDLAMEWTKYGVAASDTMALAAQAAGAGFKGADLTAQVNAATKAAVLGQIDMQKAMQATIALQNTFKLSSGDLGKSINYMNQLENQTVVTFDDMTTAIPKAGTVIKGLGGDIKTLGTLMAALEEGGVGAAEAANTLKSGLGSLLNPSKAARSALKSIGIDMDAVWSEAEKNGQGVLYVVEQLGKSMDKLGQTKRQQVMEELFGKHQFARMNALLTNINSGQQALTAKQVAGGGQLEAAIVAQQELGKLSASNLTKFQSAIEKLRATIAPLGEQVVKVLTPIVDFATKMIDKFNNLPDIFKNIGTALVLGIGVVAPVFLMILGQIQNMLGNGMKLLNFIRGWGKDTKWVAVENMTLSETLNKIGADLIAENDLLKKNTALWKGRSAAAASGPQSVGIANRTTTTPMAVPTPATATRPGFFSRVFGRRRFATGGTVAGSGNKDTIPALLTPGEFVVNKEASSRYGSILSAMNSGDLPGFAKGTSGDAGVQYKKEVQQLSTELKKEVDVVVAAREAVQALMPGIEVGSLWSLTHYANSHLEHAALGDPKVWNANTIRVDNQKLNLAMEKYNHGVHATTTTEAKTVLAKLGFNLESKYGTLKDRIYQMGSPSAPTQETANLLSEFIPKNKKMAARMANELVLQGLLKYRESTGWAFYKDLMDVNKAAVAATLTKEYLGPKGPSGSQSPADQINKATKTIEFLKKRRMGIRGLAKGGIVPGNGNEDTVPTLLTPGEAVMTKSATQRFGSILSAMNSGAIGMFARGKDPGYDPNKVPEGIPSAERRAMLDEARKNIDTFVKEFSEFFREGTINTKKLRKQIQKDLEEQTVAAHVTRTVDPVTGKKIYRNDVLASASARENQGMEDLAKENNQAVLRRVATEFTIGDQQKEYIRILDQLKSGEHLVVEQDKKLLQQLIVRTHEIEMANEGSATQKKYRLSEKYRAGSIEGQAFAAALPQRNIYFETKQPMTEESRQAALAASATRTGVTPKPTTGGLDTPAGRERVNNAFSMATTALLLFGSGLTGATDSLGGFGTILDKVTPALMALTYLAPGAPGAITGKLGEFAGKLPSGGRFGKLGRLGLGASTKGLIGGGIAGIGLGVAGNFVGSKVGGTVGGGISGAATGAGIGMLLGPEGAAVGALIGGIIGATKAYKDNQKAIEAVNKSTLDMSKRWADIGDSLQEQFDIGGGKSWLDRLGIQKTGKQDELYQKFQEAMKDPDSPWAKTLTDIKDAASRHMLEANRIQMELETMISDMRGRGVDEESIKTIAQGFIAALPENMRQGLSPNTYEVSTTNEILKSIDNRLKNTAAFAPTAAAMAPPPPTGIYGTSVMPTTGYYTQPSTPTPTVPTGPGYAENPRDFFTGAGVANAPLSDKQVGASAAQLMNIISSLRSQYLTALEAGQDTTKITQDLGKAMQIADENFGHVAMSTSQLSDAQKAAIETATSVQTEAMISAPGSTAGITVDDWHKILQSSDQNAIDLNLGAQALIKAGYSLDGVAPAMIAAAGKIAANISELQTNLAIQKQDLEKWSGALKDLENIKANKTTELASHTPQEYALSRQDVSMTKLEASLDVKRINIETGALADFVGRFNKAFGTSIDSFADAQYQIDKIGNKIRTVQLTRIEPLQNKVDHMNHANELAQREIDKLEKQKAKRAEETNKQYEDQAALLEQINTENQRLVDKQQSLFDMASAIAGGDVGAAVGAQLQMRQQENQQYLEDQQKALEQQKAAGEQTPAAPEDARIKELQDQIDKRNESIQKIEDKIYAINDKVIKPLQRRQDLMSNMLQISHTETENAKANAGYVDQENEARKHALVHAKQAKIEADKMLDLQTQINKKYEDQITAVATRLGLEERGYNKIHDKIVANKNAAVDEINTINSALTASQTALNNTVTNTAETKPVPDSVLWVGNELLKYIYANHPELNPNSKEWKKAHPEAAAAMETKASGGIIAGSSNRDSVHALLTPGEFVMRKSAVDRIGTNRLARLNRGSNELTDDDIAEIDGVGKGKGFAAGGTVKSNLVSIAAERAVANMLQQKYIEDYFAYGKQKAIELGLIHEKTTTDGQEPLPPLPPGADGGTSKRFGHFWAVVENITHILSGLRYASGMLHAEPWVGGAGGHRLKDAGVFDIGTAGTAAHALLPGVVTKRTHSYSFGPNMLVLTHDGGAQTRYAHMDTPVVSVGERVAGGQYLGRAASHSTSSTFPGKGHDPHIHFAWHGIANLEQPPRHGRVPWYVSLATGGLVPGVGSQDTVRAMLTPGEFVINKNAVSSIGVAPLKSLNQSRTLGRGPIMPQLAEDKGMAVYNEYNLQFNILEADDADEVANTVMYKLERATRSKMRTPNVIR